MGQACALAPSPSSSRVECMKQQLRVEPQRQLAGRGWQPCAPHQAQAWAVVLGTRVLSRANNRAVALEQAATALLRKQGPKRRYSFGARMPAYDGEPVARSLTKEQYLKLKEPAQ